MVLLPNPSPSLLSLALLYVHRFPFHICVSPPMSGPLSSSSSLNLIWHSVHVAVSSSCARVVLLWHTHTCEYSPRTDHYTHSRGVRALGLYSLLIDPWGVTRDLQEDDEIEDKGRLTTECGEREREINGADERRETRRRRNIQRWAFCLRAERTSRTLFEETCARVTFPHFP